MMLAPCDHEPPPDWRVVRIVLAGLFALVLLCLVVLAVLFVKDVHP